MGDRLRGLNRGLGRLLSTMGSVDSETERPDAAKILRGDGFSSPEGIVVEVHAEGDRARARIIGKLEAVRLADLPHRCAARVQSRTLPKGITVVQGSLEASAAPANAAADFRGSGTPHVGHNPCLGRERAEQRDCGQNNKRTCHYISISL